MTIETAYITGEVMAILLINGKGLPNGEKLVGIMEDAINEIPPMSFYQVNPKQMVRLYDKATEYAQLTGEETVLNLYYGVGTIGRYMVSKARKVIGIESVKGAVLDANRNAVINGIVNAEFVCGKVEEELPKLLAGTEDEETEFAKMPIKPDVVIYSRMC